MHKKSRNATMLMDMEEFDDNVEVEDENYMIEEVTTILKRRKTKSEIPKRSWDSKIQ